MGQNPVDKLPGQLRDLVLALRVPEQVLPVLGLTDTLVCMPLPFTPTNGLGRKHAVSPMLRGHLAANQLVDLDLIGGRYHFAVAVVDLELRRRNLRVVFLVLEAHRPLHFGRPRR